MSGVLAKMHVVLYEDQEIVFVGDFIWLPSTGNLRKNIIGSIHKNSHSGLRSLIYNARCLHSYATLRQDCKEILENCHSCSKFAKSKTLARSATKYLPSEMSPLSDQQIDVLEMTQNQLYLVSVDLHSGFITSSEKFTSKSTTAIIRSCLQTWNKIGFPELLRADNGTYFIARQLWDFCTKCNINLEIGSP